MSLMFRAAVGVVNTAAKAANALLEQMYPTNFPGAAGSLADGCDAPGVLLRNPSVREDKQQRLKPAGPHTDSPREGVEAALADPHPVGVDDPAGGHVPPAPPAGSLTWQGWAVPAILEVLAEHKPCEREFEVGVYCAGGCGWGQQLPAKQRPDWQEWREHVAPLIADRIGCDPARAALALTSLQTQ